MTDAIRFYHMAGGDLEWNMVAFDAFIHPKPMTTKQLTATAEEAHPPAVVRRGE